MSDRHQGRRPTEMETPLLLTARQAAALCGKSLRTWRSGDAAGLIPQPVRIRRCTLWRADELRRWIAAGCPNRQQLENSRESDREGA